MSKQRSSAETFVQDAFAVAQKTPAFGKDQLIIWGGDFDSEHLPTFLEQWGDTLNNLTWRIVVQPSHVKVFKSLPIPTEPNTVNRLHLFGETGDLLIRRDEATFFWRFIGLRTIAWPQLAEADDYWAHHPDEQFIDVEAAYIQWRKGDDRVGLDLSNYFDDLKGQETDPNVVLKQVQYLSQGRLAFVRCTGLEIEGEQR